MWTWIFFLQKEYARIDQLTPFQHISPLQEHIFFHRPSKLLMPAAEKG
jgi:hypothetical protein